MRRCALDHEASPSTSRTGRQSLDGLPDEALYAGSRRLASVHLCGSEGARVKRRCSATTSEAPCSRTASTCACARRIVARARARRRGSSRRRRRERAVGAADRAGSAPPVPWCSTRGATDRPGRRLLSRGGLKPSPPQLARLLVLTRALQVSRSMLAQHRRRGLITITS